MKWFAAVIFAVCCTGQAAPAALVYDIGQGNVIRQQGTDEVRSIASLTKLMTAMVVLDRAQSMSEMLIMDQRTHTVLPNKNYSRLELIHAMLIRSDNAAAETLAVNYPGGRFQFVLDMNRKSQQLGLFHTKFLDPSGLSVFNVSTLHDLAIMTAEASNYELIRTASTLSVIQIQQTEFSNTGGSLFHILKNVVLTKTGFTNHAGYCVALVMNRHGKDIAVIVLGSQSKQQRIAKVEQLVKSL